MYAYHVAIEGRRPPSSDLVLGLGLGSGLGLGLGLGLGALLRLGLPS